MDGQLSGGATATTAPGDILLGETGLELPLAGGSRAYFNYYWLRDNCPTSFDRETRERTYDIFQDIEPRPASARLDGPEGERVLEIVRSEEHTSELQSLMRISYAVFCLKKTNKSEHIHNINSQQFDYTSTTSSSN